MCCSAFLNGYAIVGSAGNPAWVKGYVTAMSLPNCVATSQEWSPLVDNVTTTDHGEVLAPAGQTSAGQTYQMEGQRTGLDVFTLTADGKLVRAKTCFLGVTRSVGGSCSPKFNQITQIVY